LLASSRGRRQHSDPAKISRNAPRLSDGRDARRPKGSGKSSLLALLQPASAGKPAPAPTVALEYVFARRSRNTSSLKDVAHIWELGGSAAERRSHPLWTGTRIFREATRGPAARCHVDIPSARIVRAARSRRRREITSPPLKRTNPACSDAAKRSRHRCPYDPRASAGGMKGDGIEDLVGIPVTTTRLKTAVLAVVVDLSNPQNVIPVTCHWLKLLRKHVQKVLGQLRAAGDSKTADELVEGARKNFGEWHKRKAAKKGDTDKAEHPDRRTTDPCAVPLLIIANHWDALSDKDSRLARGERVGMKALCQALRYLAHQAGATLVFTSANDKALQKSFRSLLSYALFHKVDKATKAERSPDKAIYIPRGADTFDEIMEAGPIELSSFRRPLDDSIARTLTEDVAKFFGAHDEDCVPQEEDPDGLEAQARKDDAEEYDERRAEIFARLQDKHINEGGRLERSGRGRRDADVPRGRVCGHSAETNACLRRRLAATAATTTRIRRRRRSAAAKVVGRFESRLRYAEPAVDEAYKLKMEQLAKYREQKLREEKQAELDAARRAKKKLQEERDRAERLAKLDQEQQERRAARRAKREAEKLEAIEAAKRKEAEGVKPGDDAPASANPPAEADAKDSGGGGGDARQAKLDKKRDAKGAKGSKRSQ